MRKFSVIAHRGAASICPENTTSSFKKALEIGSDIVEIDIQLTKDGYWVVVHDDDIFRYTSVRAKVRDLTLQELKTHDFGTWFGREFEGERILTLSEACAMILPHAYLILDIKAGGKPADIAKRLIEGLAGMTHAEKIILSSFSITLLKRLRALSAEFKLGYLFENHPRYKTWMACREKFYSIHPRSDVFSEDIAKKAHLKGISVYVWTVNQTEEMKRALEKGADGFFTDFPQRAKEIDSFTAGRVSG